MASRERIRFTPRHGYYVGIDSDGCVFDSMELKNKECFIPQIIKHWNLQAVSKYARQTAEFVNLYSHWRGTNRFPALVFMLDLLRERPEVQARRVEVPRVEPLREFIRSGVALGNPALEEAVRKTGDPVLTQALTWSKAVNAVIADMVRDVPPFPLVRECLEKLSENADIIVVSGTPGEALEREWEEHGIARFASVIAGQECGTKTEHIGQTAGNRYPEGHALMIGDSPGDMKAAHANGVRFYPIVPGEEEKSWEFFHRQVLDLFFKGEYTGSMEIELLRHFNAKLPEKPPWIRS